MVLHDVLGIGVTDMLGQPHMDDPDEPEWHKWSRAKRNEYDMVNADDRRPWTKRAGVHLRGFPAKKNPEWCFQKN